jgi:GH15 family glucan-1,4-alpha-glucosidase
VRPFELRPLFPAVRQTLLRLALRRTPFGITPGEGWTGGKDPWTAPTAWTAWALAGLAAEEDGRRAAADRRAALCLLADLRRAATPAGALPERVDAKTGLPRSTTPLLWSHAFTVLALRELWPDRSD